MIQYIFTNIFKCFNIHKSHRMNHPHLTIITCQFTASFDKTSIKIRIKLQGLGIIRTHKFFQFSSKIRTIRIRRICYSHIKLHT